LLLNFKVLLGLVRLVLVRRLLLLQSILAL
jgi:hypothetical protein